MDRRHFLSVTATLAGAAGLGWRPSAEPLVDAAPAWLVPEGELSATIRCSEALLEDAEVDLAQHLMSRIVQEYGRALGDEIFQPKRRWPMAI